jgi:hypothetical protein
MSQLAKERSRQDAELAEAEHELEAEKQRAALLDETREGALAAQERTRLVLADAQKAQAEGNEKAGKLRQQLENSQSLLDTERQKAADKLRALGVPLTDGTGVEPVQHKLDELGRELREIDPLIIHLRRAISLRKAHAFATAEAALAESEARRDELRTLDDEEQAEKAALEAGMAAAKANFAAAQAEADRLKAELDLARAPTLARKAKLDAQILEGKQMHADAQKAVDKQPLDELRSMHHPPPGVELVLEAVMLVIGKGVHHNSHTSSTALRGDSAWNTIYKQLQDEDFLQEVLQLDPSTLSKQTVKHLQSPHFLTNPAFEEEKIAPASLAAGSLCHWLKAQVALAETLIAARELEAEMAALEESLSGLRQAYEDVMRQIEHLTVSPEVRKTAYFFEFSLCLSRACLGKMIVFIHKWLKNAVFLQELARQERRLQEIDDAAVSRAAESLRLEQQMPQQSTAVAALKEEQDADSAALVVAPPAEATTVETRDLFRQQVTDLAEKIQQHEGELETIKSTSKQSSSVDDKLSAMGAQLADKTARKSVLEQAVEVHKVLLDEELQHQAKREEIEAAMEALGFGADGYGQTVSETEAALRKLKETLDKNEAKRVGLDASLAKATARFDDAQEEERRLEGLANKMRPPTAVDAELTALNNRCGKRHFLSHLYIKMHYFTKTGSGQT